MPPTPYDSKTLGELTPDELRAVISALTPDEDLHTGKIFLLKLLERSGVGGVVAFVEKMHGVLDKEGKLEEYDFDKAETALLKECRPNMLSRRRFLTTIGYGAGGATLIAYGGMNIADNIISKDPPPADATTSRRGLFGEIKKGFGKWAVPIFAEIGIGAALINEVVKDWREAKLEEVANAVAEMAERLPKPETSPPTASR